MISLLRNSLKTAVVRAVLGITLVAVGSMLMLVAVGFGIHRGDMGIETATKPYYDRLGRAAWLALAWYFAAEVAASLLLTAIVGSWLHVHWALRFLALLIVTSVCSYLATLLILNYGTYCPPIWSIHDVLSDLVLKMTP